MTSPLSPACPTGRAMIHVIGPSSDDPGASRAVLNRDELERASRFRFPHDTVRWISRRAGLRRILGRYLDLPPAEVPLQTGPNGKPELAGPLDELHFNLSHSRDLAVVLVCHVGPVGIDLEALDRAPSLLECFETFCHPHEVAELPRHASPRAEALLKLWVAKEALLKALGRGLGFPLRSLRVHGEHATSDQPLPGLEFLKLVTPSGPPDCRMAVAVPLQIKGFELRSCGAWI